MMAFGNDEIIYTAAAEQRSFWERQRE